MPTIYITLHMRTGLHGWAFNVLLALNIGQSLYPTSLDTVPPNHLKKMTCPSSCARHMTKLTKFNHTQPSWLQSINQSISLSLSLSLSLCTRPTDPPSLSLYKTHWPNWILSLSTDQASQPLPCLHRQPTHPPCIHHRPNLLFFSLPLSFSFLSTHPTLVFGLNIYLKLKTLQQYTH